MRYKAVMLSAIATALLLCGPVFGKVPKGIKPEEAKKIEAAAPTRATVKPARKRRVLAFTRPAGFRHPSIPHTAYAVKMMGEKSGAFETVISDDLSMFLPDKLSEFDAVVLCNTTGKWIRPRKNESHLDEKVLRKSLMNFVKSGKGIAGIHAASDANYHWGEFGVLIGGWFWGHPWHEKVGIHVEEKDHPLARAFKGKDFTITDEIYQFKDPYTRENVRVLLRLDTKKTNMKKRGIRRRDGDFAVAWCRSEGKGRVFYSSLGHRKEIFWNPTIMAFYLDGIQYAIGDIKADSKASAKIGRATVKK